MRSLSGGSWVWHDTRPPRPGEAPCSKLSQVEPSRAAWARPEAPLGGGPIFPFVARLRALYPGQNGSKQSDPVCASIPNHAPLIAINSRGQVATGTRHCEGYGDTRGWHAPHHRRQGRSTQVTHTRFGGPDIAFAGMLYALSGVSSSRKTCVTRHAATRHAAWGRPMQGWEALLSLRTGSYADSFLKFAYENGHHYRVRP